MSHNGRTIRGGKLTEYGRARMARAILKGRWARRKMQYQTVIKENSKAYEPVTNKAKAIIHTL